MYSSEDLKRFYFQYQSEALPHGECKDMAADEKDRFIQYLVDKVNMFELDKRATDLAVEEFQATFDGVSASLESIKKEMEDIKAELREERSKRKRAEAKARKLDQQLNIVLSQQ